MLLRFKTGSVGPDTFYRGDKTNIWRGVGNSDTNLRTKQAKGKEKNKTYQKVNGSEK